MSFPPSPRGEMRIRWTSRVPPPLLGCSSTRLTNQWKTPCWNSRSTPNRRPSTHSNGCSLHWKRDDLAEGAVAVTAPSGDSRVKSAAGMPTARLSRSVLETRGQNRPGRRRGPTSSRSGSRREVRGRAGGGWSSTGSASHAGRLQVAEHGPAASGYRSPGRFGEGLPSSGTRRSSDPLEQGRRLLGVQPADGEEGVGLERRAAGQQVEQRCPIA